MKPARCTFDTSPPNPILALVVLLWAIVGLVSVACGASTRTGNDSSDRSAVATPAPCPSPVDADFAGAFTEECVRSYVPWSFKLPHMAEFSAPVFQFNPKKPGEVLVQFRETRQPDLRLRLDMFPIGIREFLGDQDLTSPHGHIIGIGRSVYGFAGGWNDATATYIASVVDGTDTSANRALILEAADSILDNSTPP